ncbi:MAG: DUF2142 domain-containing protein [Lachnospiraceae bacterium]|nr:DUF2142 domain-containing protein [Lachnospiraceae bacterium]
MKNFFDKNTKRSNRVFAAYAGILCLVLVWNLFHCSSWSWDIRQLPLQEGCGISPDEEGRFEFRDGKELTLRFEAPGPQEVREGAELCGAALLNYENRNHLRFSTEAMTAVLRDESGRERAASRLPLIRQTPSVYDETLLYFSFDTDETAQIGREETLELVVRSEGLTRNGVFFGTDRFEGKEGTEADPAVRIYYRTKTFSPFLSIFYFVLEILAGLFCLRMVNVGGMPLFPAKDSVEKPLDTQAKKTAGILVKNPSKKPEGISPKKPAKRQEGISAKKSVKNPASGPAAGKAAASAAGLLALLAFMGFTYIYAIRPLAGTCSAEILCSREDASDSITLEPGDTLRQTVRCGQDRLSGFGIFLEKGTKTDADEVNPEDSGDPAESAGSADSTDSAGSVGASGSEESGDPAGSTDSAGSAGSGASAGSTGPARIAWKLYDVQAAAAGGNLSESGSPAPASGEGSAAGGLVPASGEETGVENPVLASGEGSVDSLRSVRSLLGHDAQGTEVLDASEKAVWLPLDAPVRAAAGRTFLLELTNMGPGPVTITATGQTNGTATMIAEAEADNADGRDMAGGEVFEKEICLMAGYRSNGFINGFFLRLCAVVLVLFAAIQAFCVWKNPSVQALYLACALSLGLVYSFVTPAYTVSDERTHIDSIYMMSNQLLGMDELPGPDKLYKRAADIDSSITNTMPLTAARYRAVEEGLLRGIPSDAGAASANSGAGAGTASGRAYAVGYARTALENVTVFNYLPAALGFTLGRLTGRNLITMVMLARWMNLLACAAVMYAAVRIMPRGKACLAMIGLFPKTLQQTASCSYDGMLIAGTCFFIACFLAVRDGLQKQRDISALEVLLLLYAGCFVAANKAGTYLPVTGLILLLPLYGRQWTAGAVSAGTAGGVSAGTAKGVSAGTAGGVSAGTAKGTGRKQKNPLVLQCVLIMAGFCSVFAAKSLVRVFGMLSRSSGSETLVSGTRTLYSIADFLHSPAGLVRVMVNTLRLRGDGLLGELVGKNLCQRWVFVYAFLFLAWLGILAEKRTPARRKGREKTGSAEENKALKENAAWEKTGTQAEAGALKETGIRAEAGALKENAAWEKTGTQAEADTMEKAEVPENKEGTDREESGREQTGKISDKNRDLVSRVWIFLLICAGTFLIFLSMLLGFTEKGLGYVDGLQGRYFLPYAPLIFLILRTRRLERKDLTDTMILRAGFFLELLTFFEILCAYFHVW